MTAAAVPKTTRRAGRRVEQARYRVPEGVRALYAQRIDGHVALIDAPVDHAGRVLLVERHVEALAELEGLVAAYVEHSTQAKTPGLLASRLLLDELADQVGADAT
jgi:hypothetical protein